jgi:hypothetical protein
MPAVKCRRRGRNVIRDRGVRLVRPLKEASKRRQNLEPSHARYFREARTKQLTRHKHIEQNKCGHTKRALVWIRFSNAAVAITNWSDRLNHLFYPDKEPLLRKTLG